MSYLLYLNPIKTYTRTPPLVPVITHQTNAPERKAILESVHEGRYRTIVTSKVLNEGVDVPEAKVAVVLGGSVSVREYVQPLGRKTVDERIVRQRRPPQT